MSDAQDVASLLQQQIQVEKERADRAEAEKKAIYEEFSKAGDDKEKAIETARTFLASSLPDAILQIRHLMQTSESDSVRASLSKFVVTSVLDHKLEDRENTELKALLTQLQQAPTATTATT